jgi:uncharacterized protein (TIGR03083 family)
LVPDHDADPAELYERERLAFVALLRALPAERLMAPIPATPAWTVHDALSHVVGITADLNAQEFGAGDSDSWTARQVETRRHDSIDDLATEWDREAPTFVTGLRLFGYQLGAHYLGDLLQHVGDVSSALGRSPVRDDMALAVALDFYLASFEETLDDTGVGAVEVRAGGDRWQLGTADLVASVSASRYELFRALGGRRTLDEIRDLPWSGSPEAVTALVSRYSVPNSSLGER